MLVGWTHDGPESRIGPPFMLPMLLGPTEVELWRRSVPGRPESIREKIWPRSRTEQMCSGSSILPSQSWLV